MKNEEVIIPDCPFCGSNSGVYANERASGYGERQWSRDGVEELNTDRVYYVWSYTLRCPDCGKVRKDVKREGDKIVKPD